MPRCRKHRTNSRFRVERDAPRFRGASRQPGGDRPATGQLFPSNASWQSWSYRNYICRATRCGNFASFNEKLSVLDLVVVLKQAPLRRAGSPGAVLVINAAVTGAHEQAGLRKPSNRTSQMRAINRKYLELLPVHVSYPARDICRVSIPGIDYGIPVNGKPGLARRKLSQLAERKPRIVMAFSRASHRRHKEAHDRHGENCSYNAVEQEPHLHQEIAPFETFWQRHRISPVGLTSFG